MLQIQMSSSRKRQAAALSVAIALVWLGMLIGVSFLATPAKFLSPSLTLPVALDIGRHTFAVFSKVELALALCLMGLALSLGEMKLLCLVLITATLLALQVAWILPALDARVQLIIAGGTPPPSALHSIYIVIDASKLVLLGMTAFAASRCCRAQ